MKAMYKKFIILAAFLSNFALFGQTNLSPKQRIANCKAQILFDTWFSIVTHPIQQKFLNSPAIDGGLSILTAAGRGLTGHLAEAKDQSLTGIKQIGSGLKNHKTAFFLSSCQLACAYWLKGHAVAVINSALVPVPKTPTPPLRSQVAHTVAPLLANCLMFDALCHARLNPSAPNITYLAATGLLHYHHPALVDKYILNNKKSWSALDKQLALAQNTIPTAVSNIACG